jgi:hypothetical protein
MSDKETKEVGFSYGYKFYKVIVDKETGKILNKWWLSKYEITIEEYYELNKKWIVHEENENNQENPNS